MDEPRTLTLGSAPNLGVLFARAAATSRGRGGELADVQVRRPKARVHVNQLAAYNKVCGFPLRDALPSTYLHIMVFPLQVTLMVDRRFPLALAGLVHVRNTIRQHRPVDVNELLNLRSSAQGLRHHPKGALVDLVGEVRVGDELVWEGVSTYLARGASAPGELVDGELVDGELVDGELMDGELMDGELMDGELMDGELMDGELVDGEVAREELAPETPVDVDLDADARPNAVWSVPGDMGRRYAAVSGDVNPMHLSSLAARAFGFPRTLVHGMWTKAHALAAIEARIPDAYAVDVAFSQPLLLPSVANFVAAQRDQGWDFAVRPAEGTGDHLRGTVRPM